MNKSIIPKTRNILILIFLCLISAGGFFLAQAIIYKQNGVIVGDEVCMNVTSETFSLFIGVFFCLGGLIASVGVSLMKAWSYIDFIDRIENPIFAKQMKFWIDEKADRMGWKDFFDKARREK